MARQRILPLLSCLVIALAVASLSGVGALRKISTFQPLGFEALPIQGSPVFEVTRVTDPATGLRVGDQLGLVEGAIVSHPGDLARQLRQRPTSRLSVLRGDALVEAVYRRPPLDVDVPYLILAVIGAFSLLIGLYTLLRHRTASGTLFSLWCSATAALYLLSAVPPYTATLDRIIYLADQAAINLLPALSLHFFSLFPMPAPWLSRPRRRRLLPFLYLPGAALLALKLDLALAGGRLVFGRVSEEAIARLDQLDLLYIATGIVLVVALLAERLVRSESWEERRQMQWIAIGVSLGYVPFLLLGALPAAMRLTVPEPLSAAAVLPLALVPLTFAYAILRYKLWDIEVVARSTISATITLLLGMIGFGLVYLAIDRSMAEHSSLRSFLVIGAGLVMAGLLVPTRHTVSAALERLQYRGTFGQRKALLSFGRELLHERDLGRLSSALLEKIEAGVGIEQVNLYLLQGGQLTAIRPEPCLPESFPAERLPPAMLEGEVCELAQQAGPLFQKAPQADLFEAGYRYAFPLTVRGRAIGVALAGVKPEGVPLNSDDLDLIRHLLDQAALAIENAQLVGQLQRQLAEVESLKSYSEGIFESSPAGIAVLDAERRVVSANSTFAAIAGKPREAMIGKPVAEALPVWPLPRQSAEPVEVSYCEESGRERHLQVSLAAFDDCPFAQTLSILVVHDVSVRAEMERALKEKDRLAALGMLAAGVAHEVNTPITGISSYAQMLLADTPETDPRHNLLKKVEQQTFRAARIVNNLLETARNRQEDRREVFVEPLLAECVDLFSDRLGRRRVQVEWEVPPDSGRLAVWAAEGELQQVFTNLVSNAIDAMTGSGKSGGKLTLGLAGDAKTVRIRVSDSGPGISESHLASIFEPFFSTKTNRGGTGLGLAISRGIVEAHHGHLSVASHAGKGACFTVELPRHTPAIEL